MTIDIIPPISNFIKHFFLFSLFYNYFESRSKRADNPTIASDFF